MGVPELPEVETVARLLRPRVEGAELASARVSWRPSSGGLDSRALTRRIAGRRVAKLWRRAKYLIFDLEHRGRPDGALVGHLRMSGRMHVERADAPPGPWCRLALCLADGDELRFVDVRKFGRLEPVDDVAARLAALGPEPLDGPWDGRDFARALGERRRQLKPLLLDQGFLAGLGNIYVDESLFRARLHPLMPSERVPRAKALALWEAIQSTLREAIEREGSSFDTFYRTPEGQPGSYQHQFQVYGRAGRPCPACGAAIRRTVVAQRGTHLCPRCQRAPRAG